jgi:hypothetical protein
VVGIDTTRAEEITYIKTKTIRIEVTEENTFSENGKLYCIIRKEDVE